MRILYRIPKHVYTDRFYGHKDDFTEMCVNLEKISWIKFHSEDETASTYPSASFHIVDDTLQLSPEQATLLLEAWTDYHGCNV